MSGVGMRTRGWWILSLILVILLASLPPVSKANHDAKRLYDDLLRKNKYNKLIRPVGNSSEGLTVRLGLRLAQLIDVVSDSSSWSSSFSFSISSRLSIHILS